MWSRFAGARSISDTHRGPPAFRRGNRSALLRHRNTRSVEGDRKNPRMIITRTPFRISFAGGGSDLPAFYSQEPGTVLSVAIDRYMYLTVKERFGNTFRVSYSQTEIRESRDD